MKTYESWIEHFRRNNYKVCQGLSELLAHYSKTNNTHDEIALECIIKKFAHDYLPRGSGINLGTNIVLRESSTNKFVFTLAWEHMINGFYVGWTNHVLTVTPTFMDEVVDIKFESEDYYELVEAIQAENEEMIAEAPAEDREFLEEETADLPDLDEFQDDLYEVFNNFTLFEPIS